RPRAIRRRAGMWITARGYRHVQPGLRIGIGGAVEAEAGSFGDDPLEFTDDELGTLVAEQRQRDPLPPQIAHRQLGNEEALVIERRREDRGPAGRDDFRPAPEADR